jgi:hypothetical protein
MHLEPFGKITMRYRRGSWHRPYSRDSDESAEGLGFGDGDGEFSGELDGKLAWSNYPRRRQDGVWTPNVRGFITTSQGEEVLVSIHGQSIDEVAAGRRRAILARVELTTREEKLRWLNTCFIVGEGEIDEASEEWWLKTYVCVNEEAQGPPALGAQPPERFRQAGGRSVSPKP